jgi:hypothetical protein
MEYAFAKLRSRAKERGREFTLTFAEYQAFATTTDYWAKRGKTKLSLSIDRIDDARGYHADNIRAVTLSFNSRRRFAPLPDWLKAEEETALRASEERRAGAPIQSGIDQAHDVI